eukprot:TRINITY_DN2337_c2_g1_i1.p1 TRINITY_DN2337_c2_g1~~TRINITY_DN2337_c2_g1_i1.p1  ORF type:complete len:758 (+),score=241.85 TRINITY_DN2337_c2_g1_i1:135-2408(+)
MKKAKKEATDDDEVDETGTVGRKRKREKANGLNKHKKERGKKRKTSVKEKEMEVAEKRVKKKKRRKSTDQAVNEDEMMTGNDVVKKKTKKAKSKVTIEDEETNTTGKKKRSRKERKGRKENDDDDEEEEEIIVVRKKKKEKDVIVDGGVATSSHHRLNYVKKIVIKPAVESNVNNDSGIEADGVIPVGDFRYPVSYRVRGNIDDGDQSGKQSLSSVLLRNLENKLSVSTLYPVQQQVAQFLLQPLSPQRDVCVCAPTGSGKTLAYAIPIAQALLHRVVPRLRALIIVPTHDLVTQVGQTFRQLTAKTSLKIECIYGQGQSFSKQQKRLITPTNKVFRDGKWSESDELSLTYSVVDVLVTTPGRLVDHLQETKGFTLEHLQFLVIDEADRLMSQHYQDWIKKVLECAHVNAPPDVDDDNEGDRGVDGDKTGKFDFDIGDDDDQVAGGDGSTLCKSDGVTRGVSGGSPFPVSTYRSLDDKHTTSSLSLSTRYAQFQRPHLSKLLFSATMLRNPAKLASLFLVDPLVIKVGEQESKQRYSLPTTLTEYLAVSSRADKPLVLMQILSYITDGQVLIFTSSVEATHRLSLLLQYMGTESVTEYSRLLTPEKRKAVLRKFKANELKILVCSDVMSRGLDVEDVQNVINYDVPVYIKTYVHRVGRTARAGRAGTAYTLARDEEIWNFKRILKKVDGSSLIKLPLNMDGLHENLPLYEGALAQLEETLQEESKAASASARKGEGNQGNRQKKKKKGGSPSGRRER